LICGSCPSFSPLIAIEVVGANQSYVDEHITSIY
jgi:hypothetical protein